VIFRRSGSSTAIVTTSLSIQDLRNLPLAINWWRGSCHRASGSKGRRRKYRYHSLLSDRKNSGCNGMGGSTSMRKALNLRRRLTGHYHKAGICGVKRTSLRKLSAIEEVSLRPGTFWWLARTRVCGYLGGWMTQGRWPASSTHQRWRLYESFGHCPLGRIVLSIKSSSLLNREKYVRSVCSPGVSLQPCKWHPKHFDPRSCVPLLSCHPH